MRSFTLILLSLFIITVNAVSLEHIEMVQVLTVDEGLAQNSVLEVEEDSFGFLWLGTQAGFSRWNGTEIVNYPRKDIDPFPGGYVKLIKMDSLGRLWIVPSNGRLYLRHELTDRFIDTGLDTAALDSPITNIVYDKLNDQLLLCTEEGRIYTWIYGDTVVQWLVSLKKGNINSFFLYKGDLYLGSDSGWEVLQDAVNPLDDEDMPAWLGDPAIPVKDTMFIDSVLYAARADDGFSIHYPEENSFNTYPEIQGSMMALDYFGSVISASNDGYRRIHSTGTTVSSTLEKSPPSLIIRSMCTVSSGQIAIGSGSTGLWMIDPYLPRVDTWKPSESSYENESPSFSADYMAFDDDSHNNRWFASYDGGIIRWDMNRDSVKSYTVSQGTVSNDNFKYLMVDRHDQVWAGSYIEGLFKYNDAEDLFEFPFSGDVQNAGLLKDLRINHILERRSGSILFSTVNGLVEYDPELNTVKSLSSLYESEDLNAVCWAAMEDRNGHIWVGTDKGIFILKGKEFVKLESNFDRVWFLTQIESGEVFAASPSGLELLTPEGHNVNLNELETALSDRSVYGVLEDHQGQFWITTNAGVLRWDRKNSKVRYFSVDEGLLSQEFNLYSLDLLNSGTVVLGSIEGLNFIDPESLIPDENPPRVLIDHVQVQIHTLSRDETIYSADLPENPLELQSSIVLGPDDNLLNISFQSIDFSKSSRIKLYYRLKGFSDNWIDVSDEQRVNFVNLPHGSYEFDLKAVKNELLSSETRSLQIEIQSRFIQTNLYKVLIFCLVLSVVLLVILYILKLNSEIEQRKAAENDSAALKTNLEFQVEQRTDELNNALENLKKTQDQIIQQEKMSSLGLLVAGVAHEINTPLGVAVLSNSIIQKNIRFLYRKFESNDLTEEDLSESLEDLEKASERLSYNLDRSVSLINNFKQVAVEKNLQDIITFDLSSSIRSLVNSLHNETKKKNIEVILAAPELLPMRSYPGDIAQVLTNLIMNSIHHGFKNWPEEKQAQITIEVEREEDSVYILFQDNGCGIPKDIIKKVFDPFFTTNRDTGGTGLGLNIVFNIVNEKLKGQIALNSIVGEGSVFALNFPRELDVEEG